MKFGELKNQDAIEALADLIGPMQELSQDPEIIEAIKSGDKIGTIQLVLKRHSRAIFEIMARSEGVDPDEYECSIITLPAKLLHVLNAPEFAFLFPAQGQKEESSYSGSATENTEDGAN